MQCRKNNSIRVWKAAAIKVTTKKASSTIAIIKKKTKASQTYHYMPVEFWDKIIDINDEPEKKTLLDDGDNDDWK